MALLFKPHSHCPTLEIAKVTAGGELGKAPPNQTHPYIKKHHGRARTSKELHIAEPNSTQLPLSGTHHFEPSNFVHETILNVDMFSPWGGEKSVLLSFRKRLLNYCLLKHSYQNSKRHILESLSENVDPDVDTTECKVELVHMQDFCALYGLFEVQSTPAYVQYYSLTRSYHNSYCYIHRSMSGDLCTLYFKNSFSYSLLLPLCILEPPNRVCIYI